MEPITETQTGQYTAKFYQDEFTESPREWSNLGLMACKHRNYDLGDQAANAIIDQADYHDSANSFNELAEYVQDTLGATVVLPLYLLDHSGITISCGSPIVPDRAVEQTHFVSDSRGWDTSIVGVIFDTPEGTREVFGDHVPTRQQIIENLEAEVKTYDQYLTGDVYGYIIEDSEGNEVDACWGFYGVDEVEAEVLTVLESLPTQLALPFA